jgi:DNA-binding transcriptional LysR family regulator
VTLDQIKTFLFIVRYGSVRAAAQQLHITQPALSARLAALEESLGAPLFERRAKGLILTKSGADFAPYARQMMDLVGRVRAEITPRDKLTGLLRIGAAETIAQAWLPALVSAVQARYDALTIEVSVDISVNLRDQLLDRSIDLALLMGPISEYSIENIELPSFELGWFSAPDLCRKGTPDLGTVAVITYARKRGPIASCMPPWWIALAPRCACFPQVRCRPVLRWSPPGLVSGFCPSVLPKRASRAVISSRLIRAGRSIHCSSPHPMSPNRLIA